MAQSWFRRRAVIAEGAADADDAGAYREGRRDERDLTEKTQSVERAERGDLDRAYDRGIKEGRRSRRGSPWGVLITLILLILAVGEVLLVVRQGSFTQAGAVIDQALSITVVRAEAPVRAAADTTGDALQNAGANLKQKAGSAAP